MKRTSVVAASILSSVMLAGAAQAAELTLYTQPEFAGTQMTFRGESRDLSGSGINDQASSAVVRSGRWEVCTQPHFGGDCMILGRGNYPTLDAKIFHRIESVRELAPVASEQRVYPSDRYAERGRYSALEVYTLPGFRGQSMKFDDEATSLDRAATDEGISSLIVREGRWQLCTDDDFNGYCRTFAPGRYPRLGRFEGTPIGSLRRVG